MWRTLSWLLGVRDDFSIYTSWHGAAGMTPDRPHLHAWHVAEQAVRERAEAEVLRWWSHVRQRSEAVGPSWMSASTR